MTTGGLQSTAPHYPLIELFRNNRKIISVVVGVTTFASVVSGPITGVRRYVVAGASGATLGMATAVVGELMDVVADTLLPQ